MEQVRKAVIPAAVAASGHWPATEAIPHELLPVLDRPIIDHVVREGVAAGLDDVLLITGRGRGLVLDYFDPEPAAIARLAAAGDHASAAALAEVGRLARVHSVRQDGIRGLGRAVAMAERHIGREPFAVLLGDELFDRRAALLEHMIAVRREHGGSVVCLMEVPPEELGRFGVAAVRGTGSNDLLEVTDLVEKPLPGHAPSNLAVMGRYVLDPAVFDVLRDLSPGHGDKVQLTDALRELIGVPRSSGGGVRGVVFHGSRFDVSDPESYLRTVVSQELADPDGGRRFAAWLSSVLVERGFAEGAEGE